MLRERIPEITVISGKGGTGKTSLVASLAALADNVVLADCDVDAADLHLVMSPRVRETKPFLSGHEATIQTDHCTHCGACYDVCRFDAVLRKRVPNEGFRYRIDPLACEGCGLCRLACPSQAIAFTERDCGVYHASETDYGPMAHARLHPGAENSGKLVSLVRRAAMDMAQQTEAALVLADGPPGIGCPVIASLTGTSMAVVVTEPTVSGEHDLDRVLSLAQHFGVPAAVCVNRWDICPEAADRIEAHARGKGATLLSRIPYDPAVTAAQVAGKPLVADSDGPAATAVRAIWKRLSAMLAEGLPERHYPRSLAEVGGSRE